MSWPELFGYRRHDGTAGVRNHVLVVSSMDVTNPLARRIAAAVQGVVPIATAFGRIHEGADRAQHERALAGLIRNPNTAAALIVGFEPHTTQGVVEAAGDCGKPVATLSVLSHGSTIDLMHEGVRFAAGMVAEAGRTARTPMPLAHLVLGLKCGGSDPTSGLIGNAAVGRVSDAVVEAGGTVILTETEDMIGAEHLLAARAATPAIGEQLCATVARLEEQAQAHGARLSALGADHLAAGITTNEEKALGSIQKAGRTALQQVTGYAERPTCEGLVFMDAIGGGIPEITGLAGEISLDAAAERIRETLLAVCAGQMTRNELQGDVESTVASVHA